jgi:hypothetical protein
MIIPQKEFCFARKIYEMNKNVNWKKTGRSSKKSACSGM